MRTRRCGWASNPAGGVSRFLVGSTPAAFRHLAWIRDREAAVMTESTTAPTRLTSLSHGGGCGCKIAPGILRDLLKGSATTAHFAGLLVGAETADDAAV